MAERDDAERREREALAALLAIVNLIATQPAINDGHREAALAAVERFAAAVRAVEAGVPAGTPVVDQDALGAGTRSGSSAGRRRPSS